MNRNLVYNQACRLSHDIHGISDFLMTFDYIFELITKFMFSNNSFEFIN